MQNAHLAGIAAAAVATVVFDARLVRKINILQALKLEYQCLISGRPQVFVASPLPVLNRFTRIETVYARSIRIVPG